MLVVGACGSRQLGPTSAGEGSAAGEESGESGESESGEDYEPCTCVDLDGICTGQNSIYDCDLPAPCPTITEQSNAEDASCVLNLLVEQQPARFYYDFYESKSLGFESWSGWFYILGQGQGIDGECYQSQFDFSYSQVETVVSAGLEAPAYFADCLDETASVMRGCIFNGISANGSVIAECSWGG